MTHRQQYERFITIAFNRPQQTGHNGNAQLVICTISEIKIFDVKTI